MCCTNTGTMGSTFKSFWCFKNFLFTLSCFFLTEKHCCFSGTVGFKHQGIRWWVAGGLKEDGIGISQSTVWNDKTLPPHTPPPNNFLVLPQKAGLIY